MKSLSLLAALAALLPMTLSAAPAQPNFAVGPQYDSTHVYVAPQDFDRFIASFVATFGGAAGKQAVLQVTPTPSQTLSQVAMTPAGMVSAFGFKTPVPYPFGVERTGYLVTDIDAAVIAARKAGAVRLVDTFADLIGRDVVMQWPGGVAMQLYWHTMKPSYPALVAVPENRLYLTPEAADLFVRSWKDFSKAEVISDERAAPGAGIGQPGKTYRRIRLRSGFGYMAILISNGALVWPYGRELTGYATVDLKATLDRAQAAGVEILVPAHVDEDRETAMVRFPGGYVAEIHSSAHH